MPNREEREEERVQVLVFEIGREEFGVRLTQVKEISDIGKITRVPRAPEFIKGLFNLRGDVISVIDLEGRLGLPKTEYGEDTMIIVIDMEDQRVGMLVPRIIGVEWIPKESIDFAPSFISSSVDITFIEGVGKLNGRLLILLDMERVLTVREETFREKSSDLAGSSQPPDININKIESFKEEA